MVTRAAFVRNVPYLSQQFSALIVNTSPTVKFICVITVCGYLLSFSDRAVQVLSVTPGFLMPPSFSIWTAFTFWCMELYFWEVLVDIITVGLCGKLIEPLWGQLEMSIFFMVTNLGVAILTSLYYLFVYFCTNNDELLFDVHIHGLAGYVAAVSVAVRQIMPDLLIAKTRLGKLTNRNIPLTVLFVSLILWVCGILDGTFPAMFTSGLLVSWVYLRFYQRHGNRSRGDSSDSFTFASFFPNVLQPLIGALVNPIHLCCLKIGVIKPHQPYMALPLTSVNVTIPGMTDPQNQERRRQIALKALSERMSKTTDSSRQNQLPKSIPASKHFPKQPHHQHHQHQHQHHQHQHHQHSHNQHAHHQHPPHHHHQNHNNLTAEQTEKLLQAFTLPAIALPPPPPKVPTVTNTQEPTGIAETTPSSQSANVTASNTSAGISGDNGESSKP